MCARSILLACAFDLPARALVLQMKQFNGICGCLYCEDTGETEPGNHLLRFWPYNMESTTRIRTRQSLLQNATEATLSRNVVRYQLAMELC